MAIKQMMLLARVQGTVMAFADVFLMLALLFAVFGVTAVLMRRPVPAAAQARPQPIERTYVFRVLLNAL